MALCRSDTHRAGVCGLAQMPWNLRRARVFPFSPASYDANNRNCIVDHYGIPGTRGEARALCIARRGGRCAKKIRTADMRPSMPVIPWWDSVSCACCPACLRPAKRLVAEDTDKRRGCSGRGNESPVASFGTATGLSVRRFLTSRARDCRSPTAAALPFTAVHKANACRLRCPIPCRS